MKYITAAILSIGLSLGANAELISKIEHYVVGKSKTGNETLQIANEVFPGEIILHKMTFTNIDKNPIKDLEIIGPVPKNSSFVEGTQNHYISKDEPPFDVNDVGVYVLYSIDNQNWIDNPEKTIQENGVNKRVKALPKEFSGIKWVIQELNPEERIELEYRVLVK